VDDREPEHQVSNDFSSACEEHTAKLSKMMPLATTLACVGGMIKRRATDKRCALHPAIALTPSLFSPLSGTPRKVTPSVSADLGRFTIEPHLCPCPATSFLLPATCLIGYIIACWPTMMMRGEVFLG
jgi:hypothetical protein